MTIRICLLLGLLCSLTLPASARQTPSPDPQAAAADDALRKAEEAYDKLKYEDAVNQLDDWMRRFSATQRPSMVKALELRARARLMLRREEDARSDFRQILVFFDPEYRLPVAVTHTPTRNLFDEVRRNAIGMIDLMVTPPDAEVTIDGNKVASQAMGKSLPAKQYTLVAVMPGFERVEQTFNVSPGSTPQPLSVNLTRISSILKLVTQPADVEVVMDGEVKGRTEPDPAAAAQSSKVFVINDVKTGLRKLEFRAPCYRLKEESVKVDKPADYALMTFKLEQAIGTILVSATNAPADTEVYLNGALKGTVPPKGARPLELVECEGAKVVEVQSRYGRDVKRFGDLKAGQTEKFEANLRPAFAIVSDSGMSTEVRGGQDFRRLTETDFASASTVALIAADKETIDKFSKEADLPEDWLKYNAAGMRVDGAAKFGDQGIRDSVKALSDRLRTQGVASIARRDPKGDQNELLLILFARGSATPDIIPWRLGDRGRIRDVVSAVDKTPPLLRPTIGLTAVDILDVPGAVVTAVESGGRAEEAGLRPGDVIATAGGAPVTSAPQFTSLIASHQASTVSLDVRSLDGVSRKVDVTITKMPSLVSLDDQGLWVNRLAVAYGAMTAERTDVLEQVAARLNLAVAMVRLQNYADAVVELNAVIGLTEQGRFQGAVQDVVVGTTQYLLGICFEQEKDYQRAEQAWRRAVQARGNLPIENGEPLKDLATRRLERLATGR